MGKSRKRKNNDQQPETQAAKVKREIQCASSEVESDGVKRKRVRKKNKKGKGYKSLASVGPESCFEALDIHKDIEKGVNMVDQPRIHIDLGKLFDVNGPRPGGHFLHSNDIKNLFMYTVLGGGRWDKPNWCNLSSWRSIEHTMFFMVGHISGQEFLEYNDAFKFMTSYFDQGYTVKNDGSDSGFLSPLESFLFYKMKKKSAKRKGKASEVKSLSPSELVLSKEQQLVNEFPVLADIPVNEKQDYVSTRKKLRSSQIAVDHDDDDDDEMMPSEGRMFAIDCEMCLSSNGKELTRVSVVNENLDVIYDTFVKPNASITDYVTQFSGITPELLENVKTTIGDVQQRLLEIICQKDIIVGHSLENDMRALKIFHEKYIDTSIIYGDQRGLRFKPSLKSLVKQYLRKEIQNNENGHCSIEDAKACMELTHLKMEKGIHFGTFDNLNESIFEAFSRADKKCAVIDTSCIARQHCFSQTRGILCTSDDQVVKGTKESFNNSDFIFAHIRDFEKLHKGHDAEGRKPENKVIKETLSKVDENLHLMIEDAPKNTLIVVLLASGFLPSHIQSLRRDREKRRSEEVTSAIKKARDCVCFIKIKT